MFRLALLPVLLIAGCGQSGDLYLPEPPPPPVPEASNADASESRNDEDSTEKR